MERRGEAEWIGEKGREKYREKEGEVERERRGSKLKEGERQNG